MNEQENTMMESAAYSAISAGMGALTLRTKVRGLKNVNEVHADGEPKEVAGIKTASVFTNAEKTLPTSSKGPTGPHKADTGKTGAATPTPSV